MAGRAGDDDGRSGEVGDRRRASQELGGEELRPELVKPAVDPVVAAVEDSLQEWPSHADRGRAEGDRTARVKAGPDPSGGHDREPGAGGQPDARRRRDPPVCEPLGEVHRALICLLRTAHSLDRSEARSAAASDVDRRNARRGQAASDLGRDPTARLLGDDWQIERGDEALDRAQQAGRGPVALWLDELLEGVQVDDDGIRLDHRGQPDDVVDREGLRVALGDELGRSDVRHEECRRSLAPGDRIARREVGVAERGPLAADPHRDSVPLGCPTEGRVHPLTVGVAAGHRGDDQRQLEPLSEERDRRVEPVEVNLGQRIMDERDVVKARPARADGRCRGCQAHVIGLAADDLIHGVPDPQMVCDGVPILHRRYDVPMVDPFRLIVGITGASGVIYGIRLLEVLADEPGVETHLLMSPAARRTIELETDRKATDVEALADYRYRFGDIAASISSGSFPIDAMAIVPCSMGTLSAIALSSSDSLLERAADVTLKERRRLVIAPREAPLHLGHLRLMVQATELGAIICPPSPGFYASPKTLGDLIDHTVGRLIDTIGIHLSRDLSRRWTGPDDRPSSGHQVGATAERDGLAGN